MQVIPAIDIKGGKVVRLEQGAADKVKVYSDDPVDVAVKMASFGVGLIHVVDLDGALGGKLENLEVIKRIIKSVKPSIELGGGIRDEKTIKACLDAGVAKVVLGTKALDPKFIIKIVKLFGDKIVVGVDARDGIVHTKGWVAKADIKAAGLAVKMKDLGVRTINYTDISRDGMLEGPNIAGLKEILKIGGLDIIASGGISTIEDVKKLKALEPDGLKGMIIGKALYEGRIELSEAVRLCE